MKKPLYKRMQRLDKIIYDVIIYILRKSDDEKDLGRIVSKRAVGWCKTADVIAGL